MKVGTKSLLFGVHQFLVHPIFVAAGWIKLYGWPKDLRLWVAFFVHDWGYWGCSDMDGSEGKHHPWVGANIMSHFFGIPDWRVFMLTHSRSIAKEYGIGPSRLAWADKMSIVIEPWWLYLPRAILSGEIKEYMREAEAQEGVNAGSGCGVGIKRTKRQWHRWLQEHMRQVVMENYQK